MIETSKSKGKGRIDITGQLGDVMKESVRTALGWIRANINKLDFLENPTMIEVNKSEKPEVVEMKISEEMLESLDIHVHFPAAAIPKDGPSAGITIATAIISLLTHRVVRNDVAMTGEISLKGKVLPVGGIKEKCLAAYQHGIKTIIIPS